MVGNCSLFYIQLPWIYHLSIIELKKPTGNPPQPVSVKIIDILNFCFVLKLPGNLPQQIFGRFPLLIDRPPGTYEI